MTKGYSSSGELTNYVAGMFLSVFGFILIVLNAFDYLAGWKKIPNGVFVIGICFVVIGVFLTKTSKKKPSKEGREGYERRVGVLKAEEQSSRRETKNFVEEFRRNR